VRIGALTIFFEKNQKTIFFQNRILKNSKKILKIKFNQDFISTIYENEND